MLRYAADYRTLLWMLVFLPGLVAVQYIHPEYLPYLSVFSFYFSISAAVVAHNHLHAPTFKNKKANDVFGWWISIFYGSPTFMWIPTHNLNHHKYVNKAGDATITWRYSNKHNLLIASTYFFVSAWFQRIPTDEFLQRVKNKNPAQFRRYMWQYSCYGVQLAMLGLAIYLHGAKTGIMVWAFTMGLPSLVSLWTVHTFNYDQHVHTDPWSKWNHSRNFVSWSLNFFLFGNGYHTAHHELANMHWSLLKEAHEKIAAEIHPDLNQRSLWWYWFKQYILAAFIPSLGTQQIGRAPFDTQEEQLDLTTAKVGFGEAGTNASRV